MNEEEVPRTDRLRGEHRTRVPTIGARLKTHEEFYRQRAHRDVVAQWMYGGRIRIGQGDAEHGFGGRSLFRKSAAWGNCKINSMELEGGAESMKRRRKGREETQRTGKRTHVSYIPPPIIVSGKTTPSFPPPPSIAGALFLRFRFLTYPTSSSRSSSSTARAFPFLVATLGGARRARARTSARIASRCSLTLRTCGMSARRLGPARVLPMFRAWFVLLWWWWPDWRCSGT